MSDLKDIWMADDGSGKLTEEQLMAYLEGRLPEEERYAVESLLSAQNMESDAVEGLQTLSADDAKGIKRQLNASLQKTLGKKKRRRHGGIESQHWNVVSIVILLLIVLMCFAFFWMKYKR